MRAKALQLRPHPTCCHPAQGAFDLDTPSPITSSCQIVSDDSESLILVDEQDNELGFLDKSACHDGEGVLHRAFSLFIFNDKGELLLQKRAAGKRLWPNYWSNSCCSHPRKGETMDTAIQRRCEQELGFQTPLQFLYKFVYSAPFGTLGSERELCWVYVGQYNQAPQVNTNEISEWCWMDTTELEINLEQNPQEYTPWFKLEWRHLKDHFSSQLPRGESHQ